MKSLIRKGGGAPSELSLRVATAVLGVAVLILLIAFGGWLGICLLTAALSLTMVDEFSKLVFKAEDRLVKRYALLIISWLVSFFNFFLPRSEYELLIFFFLALFVWFLSLAKGRKEQELLQHFHELQFALFGLIYLVFIPLFLPRLQALPFGQHWVMLFFLIVWAGDTLAYFVGKKFGKRKLYPDISPKKSVEGGLGGLAGGVIIALLYKLIFFSALPWAGVVVVPVLVGVFEQVGDFCESFLKRAYGVKDSGSLLPGHGGVLDRFDGVVFSLPVMYACARIFI